MTVATEEEAAAQRRQMRASSAAPHESCPEYAYGDGDDDDDADVGRPSPGRTSGSASPITLPRAKATSVTLFLNRLLGLALRRQHELLTAFKFLLEIAVRRARADGRIDGGVEEITSPMLLKGARVLAVPAVADPEGDANGGTPPPADAAHAVAFPADGEDGDKKLPAVGHLMMLELLPAAPRALVRALQRRDAPPRRPRRRRGLRRLLRRRRRRRRRRRARRAAAAGAASSPRASMCPAAARRRRSRRWSP